jgi:Rieske Fe-S protein
MTDVQTRTDADTELHDEEQTRQGVVPNRRAVLAGVGALGATCLLAACGTSPSSSTTASGSGTGSDFSDTPAPAGSKGTVTTGGDSGGSTKSSGGSGATVLAAKADVPSGGGVIKGDLVITQPTAGTFKAFSKVCPHAGCDVNKISNGTIYCPCHGSTFSIKDGSVTGGPSPSPLPETKVKVDGDNIVKA